MSEYLYESRYRRIEMAFIAALVVGTAGGIATLATSGLAQGVLA